MRVAFDVPAGTAFAYLSDPRHRPEWQSSLASVELLTDGPPRVGSRWRDHTRPGMVPEMEITVLEPDRTWAETGRWRGIITAELTLDFAPAPGGCVVDVRFRVQGRGVLRPLGWAATVAGVLPVRADVRRAARILSEREAG